MKETLHNSEDTCGKLLMPASALSVTAVFFFNSFHKVLLLLVLPEVIVSSNTFVAVMFIF